MGSQRMRKHQCVAQKKNLYVEQRQKQCARCGLTTHNTMQHLHWRSWTLTARSLMLSLAGRIRLGVAPVTRTSGGSSTDGTTAGSVDEASAVIVPTLSAKLALTVP